MNTHVRSNNHDTTSAATAIAPDSPCIVLYGLDETGKPRAGKFTNGTNRELLSKAADTTGLKLAEANTSALLEVAKRLPLGRLYSNGRGFVPNVRRSLYDSLLEALQGDTIFPTVTPRSWAEIEIGHLVIAHEANKEGWWEAIVLAKDGDMLTLRWRDYPKQPNVVRHRTTVALVDPFIP